VAALGNLTSKDHHVSDEDYTPFLDVWDKPDGGMHAYLYRFLTSSDLTFQHIAVWTIVQLLESRDPELSRKIRESNLLLPSIRDLSTSQPSSAGESSPAHSSSFSDDAEGNGQEEIGNLAKKIMQYINGNADGYVEAEVPGQVAIQRSRSRHEGSIASSSVSHRTGSMRTREDELRQSVRDALGASPKR